MVPPETIEIEVTTTYLEMRQRPETPAPSKLDVVRAEVPNPALNRFFYVTVGADWLWYVRRSWSFAAWQQLVEDPDYQTWIAYFKGSPAGYFELDGRASGEVEIAYFGLLPGFVGMGLGRELLDQCIQQAWALDDVSRVWLHTCTMDHPRALPNYVAAGFTEFKQVTAKDNVPSVPLEPWTGAGVKPKTTAEDHPS